MSLSRLLSCSLSVDDTLLCLADHRYHVESEGEFHAVQCEAREMNICMSDMCFKYPTVWQRLAYAE